MSASESLDEEEYCPSCGRFVDDLVDETGWCPECSEESGHHPVTSRCITCDNEFTPDGIHHTCSSCRRETWLKHNADTIESFLRKGLGIAEAIHQVKSANRAVCISCGGVIKGRRADQTYFCRKNAPCRSASRRFMHLSESYSREEALYLVERELAAQRELISLRNEVGKEQALKDLRSRQ